MEKEFRQCGRLFTLSLIHIYRITPDGEPADNEEELSPAEVQAAVENWRDQILAAISQPDQPPYTPWPEDNERPYYTDKPDWDAFGAMLLVAACHTYEEPVPPLSLIHI